MQTEHQLMSSAMPKQPTIWAQHVSATSPRTTVSRHWCFFLCKDNVHVRAQTLKPAMLLWEHWLLDGLCLCRANSIYHYEMEPILLHLFQCTQSICQASDSGRISNKSIWILNMLGLTGFYSKGFYLWGKSLVRADDPRRSWCCSNIGSMTRRSLQPFRPSPCLHSGYHWWVSKSWTLAGPSQFASSITSILTLVQRLNREGQMSKMSLFLPHPKHLWLPTMHSFAYLTLSLLWLLELFQPRFLAFHFELRHHIPACHTNGHKWYREVGKLTMGWFQQNLVWWHIACHADRAPADELSHAEATYDLSLIGWWKTTNL